MKPLYSAFLMCLLAISGFQAQIPNFSFEDWGGGPAAPPDGWVSGGTVNHPGFVPVQRDENSHHGQYAIRVSNNVSNGQITRGQASTIQGDGGEGFGPAFPVNERYDYLTGYYRFTAQNSDSAQVIVFLYKTGYENPLGYQNLLGVGTLNLPAAETYTPFSVGVDDGPIFYFNDMETPDSAFVTLSSFRFIGPDSEELDPLGNSTLVVDALQFDTFVTGVEDSSRSLSARVWPSVAESLVQVEWDAVSATFTTVRIYDLRGREAMSCYSGVPGIGRQQITCDVSGLGTGHYLMVVSTPDGYHTAPFTRK